MAPDQVPEKVARKALRMALRQPPTVAAMRQILAACYPLIPPAEGPAENANRGTTAA